MKKPKPTWFDKVFVLVSPFLIGAAWEYGGTVVGVPASMLLGLGWCGACYLVFGDE